MNGAQPINGWEVLTITAIAEEDDVLGRAVGEPLWPDRYDAESLEELRLVSGDRWFEALFQQRPQAPGGSFFRSKDFRYYDVSDDGEWIWLDQPDGTQIKIGRRQLRWGMATDTALKAEEENDWTVALLFACDDRGHMLVWDVLREKLEVPDQLPWLLGNFKKWRKPRIGIEQRASGIGLTQHFQRRGYTVDELQPRHDKQIRAEPASTACKLGKVFFRRGVPWLEAFELELRAFPLGAHDDQVDAFAWAWLLGRDMMIRHRSRNRPLTETEQLARDHLNRLGVPQRLLDRQRKRVPGRSQSTSDTLRKFGLG